MKTLINRRKQMKKKYYGVSWMTTIAMTSMLILSKYQEL